MPQARIEFQKGLQIEDLLHFLVDLRSCRLLSLVVCRPIEKDLNEERRADAELTGGPDTGFKSPTIGSESLSGRIK
jgi:hypothetical protein